MTQQSLSVGDAARALNVRPRDITRLLYDRRVSVERCPIIGGRRMIAPSMLPEIAIALSQHSRSLKEREKVAS